MEHDYYLPKLQLSTTSKMKLDYYQQKLNAQVKSQVAKQLRKIEKTEPSFICFKNIKKTTAQKNWTKSAIKLSIRKLVWTYCKGI